MNSLVPTDKPDTKQNRVRCSDNSNFELQWSPVSSSTAYALLGNTDSVGEGGDVEVGEEVSLADHVCLDARLAFSSSHRISRVSLSLPSLDTLLPLVLEEDHQDKSDIDINKDIDQEIEREKSDMIRPVHVWLVPSRVTWQVASSTLGSTGKGPGLFREVCLVPVSPNAGFPSDLGHPFKLNQGCPTEDKETVEGSYRSKHWRLVCSSVHSKCLLLRKRASPVSDRVSNEDPGLSLIEEEEECEFSWVDIGLLSAVAERFKDVRWHCQVVMSLMEASVDTDALQELHLCHNTRWVVQSLISQTQTQGGLSAALQITSQHVNHQQTNKCQEVDRLLSDFCELGSSQSREVEVGVEEFHRLCNGLFSEETENETESETEMETENEKKTENEVELSSEAQKFLDGLCKTVDHVSSEFLHTALSRKEHSRLTLEQTRFQVEDSTNAILTHLEQHETQSKGQSKGLLKRQKRQESTGLELGSSSSWWMELLLTWSEDPSVIEAIQNSVMLGEAAYRKLGTFRNLHGLAFILHQEESDLIKTRNKLIQVLSQLSTQPTPSEIAESSDCSRCRAYFSKQGPVCAICRVQEQLTLYRNYFYAYRRTQKRLVTNNNRAQQTNKHRSKGKTNINKTLTLTRQKKRRRSKSTNSETVGSVLGAGDQEEEDEEVLIRGFQEGEVDGTLLMVMKILRSFAIRYNYEEVLWVSKEELHRLDLLRQECQGMISFADRHSDLLKALDELQQCQSRVSLFSPLDGSAGEKEGIPESQRDHMFFRHELIGETMVSMEGVVAAVEELKTARGSLNFYRNQVLAIAQENFLYHRGERVETGQPTRVHHKSNNHRSNKNNINSSDVSAECVFCKESLFPGTDQQPQREEERGKKVVLLPCAHRFHRTCVLPWLNRHQACPLCKRRCHSRELTVVARPSLGGNLLSSPVRPTRPLLLNRNDPSLVDSAKRGECVTQEVDPQGTDSANNLTGSILMEKGENVTSVKAEDLWRVRGKWGSKVDALVADLLALFQPIYNGKDEDDFNEEKDEMDEGIKAIVFSQWNEMLEIVGEALRANDLPFVHCGRVHDRKKDFGPSGSIERFKTDPACRLLLLPLALGAEGLDLVVASHVFLLEPLLVSAVEAQAVNRVKRIGQRRRTFVHKYVVRDTVEEQILLFQSEREKGLSAEVARVKGKTDDSCLDAGDVAFLFQL